MSHDIQSPQTPMESYCPQLVLNTVSQYATTEYWLIVLKHYISDSQWLYRGQNKIIQSIFITISGSIRLFGQKNFRKTAKVLTIKWSLRSFWNDTNDLQHKNLFHIIFIIGWLTYHSLKILFPSIFFWRTPATLHAVCPNSRSLHKHNTSEHQIKNCFHLDKLHLPQWVVL